MASYHFALKGDVRVTVKSKSRGSGPRFEAVITGAGGRELGKGADYSEPAALGLALLAARRWFAECEGCGRAFYRDELEEDSRGVLCCGDCWGAL